MSEKFVLELVNFIQEIKKMYDICHPSYYKISQLGCSDELKISTAFYVYIELCEGRRLWDVKYEYEPELNLIYLTGKKGKNTSIDIYIPWASKTNIKLSEIENIQNKLNCTCFVLVIKGGDSTSIFYEVNRGMKKPLAPHEANNKREIYRRKLALEREIRKNSKNLYELAKSGDGEIKSTPNNTNVNDQAALL